MSAIKNKVEIKNIKKNILGTISFDMKIKGMRKFQEFSVYPINKDTKILTVQSDTRISKLSLEGKGLMSKSHQNGAYFVHLQIDKLTPYIIEGNQWQELKNKIGLTQNKEAGLKENGIVHSDNSEAKSIFDL